MIQEYPMVEVNLAKLRNNMEQMIGRCRDCGIEVAGVIKGCNGIVECAKEYAAAGCTFVASSRMEQLEAIKQAGIDKPLMLIRVPMLSEVENVISITDISLNSELEVLRALNMAAKRRGKTHRVILMADLGDLREGFWDKDEMVDVAFEVENELKSLQLAGIGTNLGCYGSIAATEDKMHELVHLAEMIEARIGRKLDIISGGATTSLPRVLEGNMPKRINMLRLGEGVILGKDLQDLWGYDMSYMFQNVFTLKAEVIEIKNKPTYPVGEIMFDAFGFRPTYEDRGIRKRALLAVGKVDYAYLDMIYPREPGVTIVGASSDHTIIDIEDCARELKIGDILEFDLSYGSLVLATSSPNIAIKCING